jgi:hypothetical protein
MSAVDLDQWLPDFTVTGFRSSGKNVSSPEGIFYHCRTDAINQFARLMLHLHLINVFRQQKDTHRANLPPLCRLGEHNGLLVRQ